MADYPNLPINADAFTIEVQDGSEATRADSGVMRIARMWPGLRFTISVEHPSLEWTDYVDLLNFYMANRLDDQINFTVPDEDGNLTGQSFLVSMLSPPTHRKMVGTKLYSVSIQLEGVMNGTP